MHLEIDRQPAEAMADDRRGDRSGAGRRARRSCATGTRCARKMREVADDLGARQLPVSDAGAREAQEFLRWAADNHFTFLGYREYEVVRQGRRGRARARSRAPAWA